jgi:hypothetical protein
MSGMIPPEFKIYRNTASPSSAAITHKTVPAKMSARDGIDATGW